MSRPTNIKILFTLGVVLTVSCSILPPIKSLFPAATQEASANIKSSEGGELTLPDKTILKIPAGGLQTDTQVSIRKATGKNIPVIQQELSTIGAAYEINLGTAALEKSATLEIPFDPTLLPNGTKPDQVFLSYYDEVTKKWDYAGGKVDTNRNVVVLEITHASWWMPTTWNWAAWIAFLNKMLQVSIVNWIQAVQLLTADCSQTGKYVQVNSSKALNLVQGCVDQDDNQQPVLRIINPKSFYYEISSISGGKDYPAPTMLAPGEGVKFTASTSDPSPLVVEAQITQRSGWFLVIHMIIMMLPGANQFGIQGREVACITERLVDVSDLASAVESLLVDHDGAAAAESISRFMLNGDAVRRFITAADDCSFGPASTWSWEGIKQIGGAVSTIMSATDYIANYFAGNTFAQLSFVWTSPVDMTNPDSIASWINFGLQNGDASIFKNIYTQAPKFGHAWASEPVCNGKPCSSCLLGKYCDISQADFINEIDSRIQSKPKCYYTSNKGEGFEIAIFGWFPKWTFPGGTYAPGGEADGTDLMFDRGSYYSDGQHYRLFFIGFFNWKPGLLQEMSPFTPCP